MRLAGGARVISRLLALLRDLWQSHPIATEPEEKWLKTLWAGHLSLQEGADAERRRLVRAGWWRVCCDIILSLLFLGYLLWLGIR